MITMVSQLTRFGWLGLFLPVLCCGALQWETQKVELTAGPADKELVAVYRFVNPGDSPVTITTLKPDCGCTTVVLEKRTYAPGETGEIKAGFTIGDRVGVYNKHIVVATEENSESPTVLVLGVSIPESLVCTPRALFWKRNDASVEKSIEISPAGERKIVSLEVTGTNAGTFARRVESVDGGARFHVLLRPASTLKVAQATLFCVAKFSDGMSRSFTLSALVR